MKLSIIIPTKDRNEILQRTINSLVEAISGTDAEILIVNDSAVPIKLKENNSGIKILSNSKSGAASARNTGVRQSTGDLLLFLDDDILINKSNILKTLSLHQNSMKSAFNFFWLYPPDLIEALPQSSLGRYVLKHLLFTNSHRVKINGNTNELIAANGLTSQYFSILKSDFLLSGGYNENIPYAGSEDLILYRELKKNGLEVYISPSDIVFQNESDRLKLHSMLERSRSGALTLRMAEKIGYPVAVKFPKTKQLVYSIFVHIKPLIYKLTMKIPNKRAFDFIYFKVVNLLLGLSFYEGYVMNSKKHVDPETIRTKPAQ